MNRSELENSQNSQEKKTENIQQYAKEFHQKSNNVGPIMKGKRKRLREYYRNLANNRRLNEFNVSMANKFSKILF